MQSLSIQLHLKIDDGIEGDLEHFDDSINNW